MAILSNKTDNPVQLVKFVDLQLSNSSADVDAEVHKMWIDYELGNDNCFVKWDFDMADGYPAIAEYLRQHGVNDDERVLIHWWW
jgi:hypothetical protein